MATVNELIQQLELVRDTIGAGETKICVSVLGETGFTSDLIQLLAPTAMLIDGRKRVIISVMKEV